MSFEDTGTHSGETTLLGPLECIGNNMKFVQRLPTDWWAVYYQPIQWSI